MSIENEVSEFLSNDDTRIDGIKTSHRMDTQNNVAENGASGIQTLRFQVVSEKSIEEKEEEAEQ